MKFKKIMKLRNRITLNPIMSFIILILITMVVSTLLSLLGVESSYKLLDLNTGEYSTKLVSITSMMSLSGLKYIFSNTVSNFIGFTPLSMLIIVLIGIGIMEKSGFLKTTFTILTKKFKKNTITFTIAFISILASISGDIAYVTLIPLSALLFKYGKRNPLIGVIVSFAGLTCGTGISVLLTSVDSSLLNLTLLGSHVLDINYKIGVSAFLFIMIVATFAIAYLVTIITEKTIALKFEQYEFEEDEELRITNKESKGLTLALIAGAIYIIFLIYNIIPGLPLSGALLDKNQILYIDKLFSYESFFSMGFVFIITILFIILGLFYGLGAKSIKNNHEFCECLSHSLDGVGRTVVLILLASIFVSVFKKSNIGTVIVASISNVISGTTFTNIPLIVLLFIFGMISTLLIPISLNKWTILSGVTIPVAMNAGLSPEFVQVIFRFSESVTIGMTPLFAYFVIYLAFLEMYNQDKKPISMSSAIKKVFPYSLATGVVLIALLIAWFLIGLPIGVGSTAVL